MASAQISNVFGDGEVQTEVRGKKHTSSNKNASDIFNMNQENQQESGHKTGKKVSERSHRDNDIFGTRERAEATVRLQILY
ncbi:Oidioi.mRNA.OKI2018_I69.chr2.g8189.t1.cds [Oikopleura dioica]|uniref:Oidioi.mRNA.OKI2018_I69.chr2.g8189.t1.cds n=1 Tax=Oikopleura dioica TaxID=34765 RepID=A0ABN7T923_OIKDI|nr:Oidioi.mRNA.OKI2018_I69.chr2.g8189.t1.cds [Oikopleura dioica]